MRDYFLNSIKSFADAEGFFFCLHQDDLLFHPEDDPSIVVDRSGALLFTDAEALMIRQRIDEVYEVMDDPCDFILSMTESDFRR
jgi:hypothetical protein